MYTNNHETWNVKIAFFYTWLRSITGLSVATLFNLYWFARIPNSILVWAVLQVPPKIFSVPFSTPQTDRSFSDVRCEISRVPANCLTYPRRKNGIYG